jgi:hypothetical protein
MTEKEHVLRTKRTSVTKFRPLNLYNNLAKPLCTVMSVHSLSPPIPAGLHPPNFQRHIPN